MINMKDITSHFENEVTKIKGPSGYSIMRLRKDNYLQQLAAPTHGKSVLSSGEAKIHFFK